MPTIKVMNWNIQNFGPTKAAMDDILRAIAKVVVGCDVDIFTVIEVNTTADAKATAVCEAMRAKLRQVSREAGRPGDFATCILSPNTGLEYYAYFVRDTGRTVPLVCTAGVDKNGVVADVTAAEFSPLTAAGVRIGFPLVIPDTPKAGLSLRHLPHWPGGRKPALGLFSVPGTAACSGLLPIVACHLDAAAASAAGQINVFPYFSLFNRLGPAIPAPAPVALKVKDGAGRIVPCAVDKLVLLGDFNVDCSAWPGGGCATLAGMGATRCINATTHLINYQDYQSDPRRYNRAESLVVNAYDNIFLFASPTIPGAVTANNDAIVMTPDLVQRKTLRLSECVKYYRELDQRGFASGDYRAIVCDFANQLAGDRSHIINVEGTLLGTRLISDHIPTLVDITLT